MSNKANLIGRFGEPNIKPRDRKLRNPNNSAEGLSPEREDINSLFDQSYQVKPLDSHFSSFGEAVFSYVNCSGYDRDKNVGGAMVRCFCAALLLPIGHWDTAYFDFNRYYFKSGDWLYEYLNNNDWVQVAPGLYFKLDEGNRPIASMDFKVGATVNAAITGPAEMVHAFMNICKANVFFDNSIPYQTEFMEIKIRRMGHGATDLHMHQDNMKHSRVALPEYYPYLNGGIDALIKDFIESDDTVLILLGPPGTGKSSAVMAAATTLGLKPIYANNTEVIQHPDFVDFAFGRFDDLLFHYQDPIRVRNEQALDKSAFIENGACPTYTEYTVPEDPRHGVNVQDENCKLPLLIIEDADWLMRPRKAGNTAMSNLLQQTDGVTSSTARKIIFNTNLQDIRDIDDGLLRVGRCYTGAPINFRLLTAEEAIVARKAAGLPDFEEVPTKSMSLAETLVKRYPKIVMNRKQGFGFNR